MNKRIATACLVIVSFVLQVMPESLYCLTPPSYPILLEKTLEKESIASVIQLIKKLQLQGTTGFLNELKAALESIKTDSHVFAYGDKISIFIKETERTLRQLYQIKVSERTARQHEAADIIAQMLIEMDWAHDYIERILVESNLLRLNAGKRKTFQIIKDTLSADIHGLRVALANNGFVQAAVYSMLDRKNGSIDQAKAVIRAIRNTRLQKEFQVMFAMGYMFGARELKNNLQGVFPARNAQQTYTERKPEESFNSLIRVVNARERVRISGRGSIINVLRQDINKRVETVRSSHRDLVQEVNRLMKETRKNLQNIQKEKTQEETVAVLMGNIIRCMRDCYYNLHRIQTDKIVQKRADNLSIYLYELNEKIQEVVTSFRVGLLSAGYPEIAADAIMQGTIEDTAKVAKSILSQADAKKDDAMKFMAAAALRSVFSYDVQEFRTPRLDITRNIDPGDLAVLKSL